jgi:hypothetical protein
MVRVPRSVAKVVRTAAVLNLIDPELSLDRPFMAAPLGLPLEMAGAEAPEIPRSA